MSKIRIKHFGPIKEGYQENDGWLEVKKVTVFIGNQGSGKSTVAKLISTLTWLEKAINRGDVDILRISKALFYDFFKYQRIKSYFKTETEIEYVGEKISIHYKKEFLFPKIQILDSSSYQVPKIMYVPAERNFLSAVKNAFRTENLPDSLYTFAVEMFKGQIELNNKSLELPIGKVHFRYDIESETSFIEGNGYKLNLLESSSGYQSIVPMYLVTKFLTDELNKGPSVLREQLNVEQSVRRNSEIAKIMLSDTLTEVEKNVKVKEVDKKYLSTCFINIVEEPEQNLFPSSQQKILNSLVEFNNMHNGNRLIMTTHSPYMISYLSISIQAAYLKEQIIKKAKHELLNKLYSIVQENAQVKSDDVQVYELNENSGTITKLPNPYGIPSDKNYLNQFIKRGNEIFDSLLELEEEL